MLIIIIIIIIIKDSIGYHGTSFVYADKVLYL